MLQLSSKNMRLYAVIGVLTALLSVVISTPAFATVDNTIQVDTDSEVALYELWNGFYLSTINIEVKTLKPYGFNLTMQANNSSLINSYDANYKIESIKNQHFSPLAANQWGYGIGNRASTYKGVPDNTQPAVVVANTSISNFHGCESDTFCRKQLTFAANVDTAKMAHGHYSTTIIYTATAKPAPKPPVVDPTVCKSGDSKNDCQVDLDANMIPVKYTGSTTSAQWTSVADPEAAGSGWYDYANKQWANAITVKKEALAKYKGQTKVVDQADILGFWVYIPRYAYEVMRRDGTDKPVPAQNFVIHFEKATDQKRYPATCSEPGKDYRTRCALNRDYIKGQPSDNGTWATHPAFTFGTKELNGIWFAKFEITGTTTQPTVLPNEAHISGNYSGIDGIGSFYSVAKSLGVNDPQNVGGKSVSSPQNSHHLAKLSSRMVNNNDWGATAYLSASKYGAGYNGVQTNSSSAIHGGSYGTTGCGPQASGNANTYNDGGATLGTQSACSSSDPQRVYNGTLGQLASTTNNPTGIYDMSGGGKEYVAASYTTNLNESGVSSDGDYFGTKAHPPYVNTYNFGAPNGCTFATCGGQALYETLGWNGQNTDSLSSKWVWFSRGSYADGGSGAGVFALNSVTGYAYRHYNYNGGYGADYGNVAFRVALVPLQD